MAYSSLVGIPDATESDETKSDATKSFPWLAGV